MKSTKSRIIIGVGVVAMIAIWLSVPHFRKTSVLFNFLFTPSDWATPLAKAKIDFGATGKTYEFEFENKYPGLHWFEVQVEKPGSVAYGYKGDFVLSLEIISKDQTIVKKIIKGPGSPYAGPDEGFEIYWYRAPSNLPLREPLKARIEIVQGDPSLFKNYGSTEIVVRKLSDE
jgi:hypothetical protein